MTFDLQPTLKGSLLTARPLKEADADALFAAARDRSIWAQHPESDRWTPAKFDLYFRGGLASGGAFAIVENASGAIIGSARYYGYDAARREIEIGWTFLVRRCWGGGYNDDLKLLMLNHAYSYVDAVLFFVGEKNLRSRRAVEKLGAVSDGARQDADGGVSLRYRLARDDWRRRAARG